MTYAGTNWPTKTRELHNHHMNSTVWNDFKMRDDDIVLATYAKSGTTWMQQILAQLIFNGDPAVDTEALSPWVDLRIIPPEAIAALEHQPHRRFLKTHLPLDALAFSPKAKYLYVGRDGRDVVWSLYNHHANANAIWYDALNKTPGLSGPPIAPPPASVHDYYREWMAKDGFPFWSYWENVRTWWEARNLPNVKLVHFNELKRDLPGSIRGIAHFLDIAIDEEAFPAIVEHCTFDYMKNHAEMMASLGGAMWEGGAQTFINKGTNGRWADTLSAQECREFDARALQELGPECAAWLSGRLA
jgi:aryl sulfotransferase